MNRFAFFMPLVVVVALTGCSGGSSTPSTTVGPTSTPTAAPTGTPTATPTANPTATPTSNPTATPTVKPTATPTSTPVASASYYYCVGVPSLTAADLGTPPNSTIPGEHIETPCAFISSSVTGCNSCTGMAINNLSDPHEARGSQIVTCVGSCTIWAGAPSSVTASLQVVSLPSNSPQRNGITYNIEDDGAHTLGYPGNWCSLYGSPYALSGGGASYTITQTKPVTNGDGLCSLDIYDQYDDYVLLSMSAQDS